MSTWDILAVSVFLILWIALEPLLKRMKRRSAIPRSMEVIRRAWMREVLTRDSNFIGDASIIGHTINSASFFGSANLLVIMAVAGTLFMDPKSIPATGLVSTISDESAVWLIQAKIVLVIATLLRGLSEFVWAVRQLNYTLAAIGSSPSRSEDRDLESWIDALSSVANPALKTFSRGVRSYYFTFAAIAWFLGPWALLLGTAFAAGLMLWRHTSSDAARGLSRIRELLEKRS